MPTKSKACVSKYSPRGVQRRESLSGMYGNTGVYRCVLDSAPAAPLRLRFHTTPSFSRRLGPAQRGLWPFSLLDHGQLLLLRQRQTLCVREQRATSFWRQSVASICPRLLEIASHHTRRALLFPSCLARWLGLQRRISCCRLRQSSPRLEGRSREGETTSHHHLHTYATHARV